MRGRDYKWRIKELFLILSFRWFHKRMKYPLIDSKDSYFWDIETVIHAGAHLGEERINYLRQNVTVYWIEAVPEIFEKLHKNLKHYPNQFALNYALTDRHGSIVELKVANQSACSSLLEINDYEALPKVNFVNRLELVSQNLDNLIEIGQIKLSRKNVLLVDTQGAELLVLKGCKANLNRFKSIILEAQDFELYAGQGSINEIIEFLVENGFALVSKEFLGEFLQAKKSFELIFTRVE